MTVGTVQLYDQCNARLAAHANKQWDDPSANAFVFVLVGDTYTPSDAHTTVANLGTGGSASAVQADTADWISSGDGAPIVVPSRSVAAVAGSAQFRGGNAAFGNPVTIPGVKYLVCVDAADFGGSGVQATDSLLFWVNLRTEDSNEVSSSASEFTVNAPDVGGQSVWRRVLAQA